jgi:recombination protein RecA
MIELLIRSGGLDAVILDALPGTSRLRPEPQPLPLLLARGLPRLTTALRGSPTAVVILKEWQPGAGGQITTSRALRHYAALRLLLQPVAPLRHPSGAVTGLRVRVEIVKNKLAAQRGPWSFELDERVGIRRTAEVIDLALAAGLIEEHRLGLVTGETLLGKTRLEAISWLDEEPAEAQALEGRVRGHWLS